MHPGANVASLSLIAGVAPPGMHPGNPGKAASSLALFEFRFSNPAFLFSTAFSNTLQ